MKWIFLKALILIVLIRQKESDKILKYELSNQLQEMFSNPSLKRAEQKQLKNQQNNYMMVIKAYLTFTLPPSYATNLACLSS